MLFFLLSDALSSAFYFSNAVLKFVYPHSHPQSRYAGCTTVLLFSDPVLVLSKWVMRCYGYQNGSVINLLLIARFIYSSVFIVLD